jgi:hypothetical protein
MIEQTFSPSVSTPPVSLGIIVAIATHLIHQAMRLILKQKKMLKVKPAPQLIFILY